MNTSTILYLLLSVLLLFAGIRLHDERSYDSKDKEEKQIRIAYSEWQTRYGKLYATPSESHYRLATFSKNYKMIKDHNSGVGSSFTMGLNEFADLTTEEFLKKRTGLLKMPDSMIESLKKYEVPLQQHLQESVDSEWDWSLKGGVGDIKNQGECGSCYGFTTATIIESVQKIEGVYKGHLSIQEMLDCTKGVGASEISNNGCDGGYMQNVFFYIMENGVSFEEDYPYQSKEMPNCYTPSLGKNKIKKFVKVPGNEEQMKLAVRKNPVAVAVDANKLQFYTNGIYDSCKEGDINHAVVAVGYGTENGVNYWKIQNSWGKDWGQGGYFKVKRQGTACGVYLVGTYPIL